MVSMEGAVSLLAPMDSANSLGLVCTLSGALTGSLGSPLFSPASSLAHSLPLDLPGMMWGTSADSADAGTAAHAAADAGGQPQLLPLPQHEQPNCLATGHALSGAEQRRHAAGQQEAVAPACQPHANAVAGYPRRRQRLPQQRHPTTGSGSGGLAAGGTAAAAGAADPGAWLHPGSNTSPNLPVLVAPPRGLPAPAPALPRRAGYVGAYGTDDGGEDGSGAAPAATIDLVSTARRHTPAATGAADPYSYHLEHLELTGSFASAAAAATHGPRPSATAAVPAGPHLRPQQLAPFIRLPAAHAGAAHEPCQLLTQGLNQPVQAAPAPGQALPPLAELLDTGGRSQSKLLALDDFFPDMDDDDTSLDLSIPSSGSLFDDDELPDDELPDDFLYWDVMDDDDDWAAAGWNQADEGMVQGAVAPEGPAIGLGFDSFTAAVNSAVGQWGATAAAGNSGNPGAPASAPGQGPASPPDQANGLPGAVGAQPNSGGGSGIAVAELDDQAAEDRAAAEAIAAAQALGDPGTTARVREALQCAHEGCVMRKQRCTDGTLVYCTAHMLERGLQPSRPTCGHPGCTKYARLAMDHTRTFCVHHMLERGIQPQKAGPTCQHPGCAKLAARATDGSMAFCIGHLHVRGLRPALQLCQHGNCNKPASFSTDGKSVFCLGHMREHGLQPMPRFTPCQETGCQRQCKTSTCGVRRFCVKHMHEHGLEPLVLNPCQHPGGCHKEAARSEDGSCRYCREHMREHNLKPHAGAMCQHAGCSKIAQWSVNGSRLYCILHMRDYGTVPRRRMCLHPGCDKKAHASSSGSYCYCAQHLEENGQERRPHNIRRCQHEGCNHYAKKSSDGLWRYCKGHMREHGMECVHVLKRCEIPGCSGLAKKSRLDGWKYCRLHLLQAGEAPVNNARRCRHDDCTKQAKKSKDGSFQYCKAHMRVYGLTPQETLKRCQHDDCTKYAKASTDGTWKYCKAHMQLHGMWPRDYKTPQGMKPDFRHKRKKDTAAGEPAAEAEAAPKAKKRRKTGATGAPKPTARSRGAGANGAGGAAAAPRKATAPRAGTARTKSAAPKPPVQAPAIASTLSQQARAGPTLGPNATLGMALATMRAQAMQTQMGGAQQQAAAGPSASDLIAMFSVKGPASAFLAASASAAASSAAMVVSEQQARLQQLQVECVPVVLQLPDAQPLRALQHLPLEQPRGGALRDGNSEASHDLLMALDDDCMVPESDEPAGDAGDGFGLQWHGEGDWVMEGADWGLLAAGSHGTPSASWAHNSMLVLADDDASWRS